MKKLLLAVITLLMVLPSMAQGQAIPNDPTIRIGKLENGLTYYIRHNDKPTKRCEFWLATNVGAFQEEDDQDGLAHFLEHMCFNGTKNFPGKSLLNYLQGIGAEFGGNINASTGFEQTQYMLNNIPIEKAGVVDSCLLIMHDYSHFVTCDPKEIDAERGVILEERRTRRNANWRMFEKSLQYYYGGTPYAKRTLIGSEEQLKTFKPESLTNFYRTWYRPDMQALIVVGDINVDEVEGKIKNIFSDIPKAVNPKAKPVVKIPDNKEPIIGIITDKEATISSIEINWKSEPMPLEMNATPMGTVMDLTKAIFYYATKERFDDIKAQPNAPFLAGSLNIGRLCNYCDMTTGSVTFKDGEWKNAFKALAYEVEKLKRYGFTNGEVERAKEAILGQLEKAATAADSRKHPEFVQPIMNNFYFNYPILDPKSELEITKAMFTQMNADMINSVVKQIFTDENIVLLYNAPEKAGLTHPTEADLLAIMKEAKAAEIAPNAEEVSNEPLLDASALKGAKLKVVTPKGQFGEEIWTLNNGVKVVFLKTDYKKDQVIMEYEKDGGKSLVATEDLPSIEDNIWGLYLSTKGIGDIPNTKLKKMLVGKNVHCQPYIDELRNGIIVQTTPKDIETAFQLLYLNLANQRFDETEFNVGINQLKAILPNLEKQPNFEFQTELYKNLFNNPRRVLINSEILGKANLGTLKKVYNQLFSGANGTTLYIVGNIDAETAKTLSAKYVGSLAKGSKPSKWVDQKDGIVDGNIVKHIAVPMETPKNTVCIVYHSNAKYSVENEVLLSAAKYVLDMVYTETLRESEGGTYGASVATDWTNEPTDEATLQIFFDTNPESADKLIKLTNSGIKDLIKNGLTEEQMTRTVENLKKNIPEMRITNSHWKTVLNQNQLHGINYDKEYEAAVNAITPEKIIDALKKVVENDNYFELKIYPAE